MARSGASKSLVARVTREGWASLADAEDLLYLSDHRVDGLRGTMPVRAWCEALKIPLRTVYYRPGKKTRTVLGSEHLGAAEAAFLLIEIERLGYAVDPLPLVRAIRPSIEAKEKITDCELTVLWYESRRHKMASRSLTIDGAWPKLGKIEKLKTETGYKIETWLDESGSPVRLEVNAPKYRRQAEPREETCAECGVAWFRGDPESSASHRREHKKRLRYLRPEVLPEYARLGNDPDRGIVNVLSPRWKHREMYGRALAFKRELSYDFPQWTDPNSLPDDQAIGLLFDIDDVIVGACSFRLRESTWCMDWVWVAPAHRRSGVLTRYWASLRERFGDFPLEHPVSESMRMFLAKTGDKHLLELRP